VAGEADVAFEAEAGEGDPLVVAKLPLPVRREELAHVRLTDLPELVPRLDEVVAGVEVSGVLERERCAAGLGVDAEGWRLAVPSELFVSPDTVNTHLRHAFPKLGIRSRVMLARCRTRPRGSERLTKT
jgi:hypothetical protein